MTMMSLKFLTFLAVTAAATVNTMEINKYLKDKPDFLKPCNLPHSDFNKCFAKNFEMLFQEWKNGIPGYKAAGTFDPLYIKRAVIAQDPKNPIAFNADLSNLVLTGASKAVIKDARFNPKTLNVQIEMFLPKLHIDSDYKLNGRILSLALNGNGKAVFEIATQRKMLTTTKKIYQLRSFKVLKVLYVDDGVLTLVVR